MTLRLPDIEHPELSVVMVTHGAWPLIERAVASLIEHTDRPFELIVVDNGSDADTRGQLDRIVNLRLLANERNRGFGPASNQGAEVARGEYLALVNSDAFVEPGWLDPLLDALGGRAVGAAVPCILHPDGSLQEAGALLARDGTARLYGDGDDAELGCYRFKRKVDYGSAVCMVLRRSTFADLEGFDARYAPAYYEDTDFCMRLARHGMSVVYEPRSRVVHVRYGSGGLDSAIELSTRHRAVFAEQWTSRLQGRPVTFTDASEQAVLASRDAVATPRFLVGSATEPSAAEPLIEALTAGWPRARLSWWVSPAGGDGFERDAWLDRGVEVLEIPDGSWLRERLFHYDVTLLDRRALAVLGAHLKPTQPQALVIGLEDQLGPAPEDLVRTLARAGIAPPER
jgi:GT2 family glycosyltransferase